jgi:hypothetical protein
VPQYDILTLANLYLDADHAAAAGKAADVTTALLLPIAKGLGIIVLVSFSACWVVLQRGWTGG